MILKKLIDWFNNRRYFVIADPRDNSVTLSRAVFRHIRKHAPENKTPAIFVFRVVGTGHYAFILDTFITQPTQVATLQHNAKYGCIGFESLNPTVNRIFYDYGISYDCPVKLSVSIHSVAPVPGLSQEQVYYQIEKPYST